MGRKPVEITVVFPQDSRAMEEAKQMSDQDRYTAMQNQTGKLPPSQLVGKSQGKVYSGANAYDQYRKDIANRGKDYDPLAVQKSRQDQNGW